MLYGQLRGLAEAVITGNKYKSKRYRELAEALITGNKYKAPSGPLRNLAEAVITGNKYKAVNSVFYYER